MLHRRNLSTTNDFARKKVFNCLKFPLSYGILVDIDGEGADTHVEEDSETLRVKSL